MAVQCQHTDDLSTAGADDDGNDRMILHLALFSFRPGTTSEEVAGLTRALTDMAAALGDVLVDYECGPGLGLTAGGLDYGVAARVDDAASLHCYLGSDVHAAVFRHHLGPILEHRYAVQIDLDAQCAMHEGS